MTKTVEELLAAAEMAIASAREAHAAIKKAAEAKREPINIVDNNGFVNIVPISELFPVVPGRTYEYSAILSGTIKPTCGIRFFDKDRKPIPLPRMPLVLPEGAMDVAKAPEGSVMAQLTAIGFDQKEGFMLRMPKVHERD